eukprot:Pgem_evm1s2683
MVIVIVMILYTGTLLISFVLLFLKHEGVTKPQNDQATALLKILLEMKFLGDNNNNYNNSNNNDNKSTTIIIPPSSPTQSSLSSSLSSSSSSSFNRKSAFTLNRRKMNRHVKQFITRGVNESRKNVIVEMKCVDSEGSEDSSCGSFSLLTANSLPCLTELETDKEPPLNNELRRPSST